MILRKYRPEDGAETLKLFYDTVHSVCCKDYRKEQLDAWAEKDRDEEKWNRSLLKNNCLIAEEDGKILGFADMDENGYLDRLYVRTARERVWRRRCAELLKRCQGRTVFPYMRR